eukprot:676078-Prorocentrum_minimum.AAC.1
MLSMPLPPRLPPPLPPLPVRRPRHKMLSMLSLPLPPPPLPARRPRHKMLSALQPVWTPLQLNK